MARISAIAALLWCVWLRSGPTLATFPGPRRMRVLSILLGSALMLCAQAAPAPQIGTFGFDEPGMDRSVKPGDDFFAYANGTWIRNTPIPADKPAYGSYIVQEEVTNQRIRDI